MKASFLIFLMIGFIQVASAATYTVPVSAELIVYAKFELEGFKSQEGNGTVTVKYNIPNLLTGVDQQVEFNGKYDDKAEVNVLTGKNGVLTCTKEENDKVECRAEYKDLQKDSAKAEALIRKIATSPLEIQGRLSVMRAFSSDPVGIIVY